jgi:2-oxoisovalerate dehydrogenase E1 component alpha subunit
VELELEKTTHSPISAFFLRDAYARMLLTRMVDNYACKLYLQGQIAFAATCCGHEAAQVGSAACIEIGEDFTLPYYRDLGVVLTIGMTPYEVFRTYLLANRRQADEARSIVQNKPADPVLHWGYHKRNTITGPAPVATQILHAAGIAFACKLRKAAAVTVAYCGDGATAEPDFLEGINFAAQHRLPLIIICEQDSSDDQLSVLQSLSLPGQLEHRCVDGTDVMAVYKAMQTALQHARDAHGPVLLEMRVKRYTPGQPGIGEEGFRNDPLLRCQQLLKEQGMWDEEWAEQLHERVKTEVEQAMQDALRDVS